MIKWKEFEYLKYCFNDYWILENIKEKDITKYNELIDIIKNKIKPKIYLASQYNWNIIEKMENIQCKTSMRLPIPKNKNYLIYEDLFFAYKELAYLIKDKCWYEKCKRKHLKHRYYKVNIKTILNQKIKKENKKLKKIQIFKKEWIPKEYIPIEEARIKLFNYEDNTK